MIGANNLTLFSGFNSFGTENRLAGEKNRIMVVVNSPNYVVAVSSVSGGGKTTLVKGAAALLRGATLFFDDYASISEYPSDLKKWVEDGADVNEWKTPQFAQDLATLRRGESIFSPIDGANILPAEFIIIEEPMGRKRAEMTPLIDFVVVIDTPLEIALARRLLRDIDTFSLEEIKKATREQLEEGLAELTYLKGYLSRYLDAIREIYIAVLGQAKENCDLVLDGSLPIDELVQQLIAAVENKPRTRNTP